VKNRVLQQKAPAHLKFIESKEDTRTLRQQRPVQDQRRLAEPVERSTCSLEAEFLTQHVGCCHQDNGEGSCGEDKCP
jgi:hypothetical protein